MIDGLDAATIVRDVAANTPPQRSKLKYTQEMLAYRHEIEEEWTAWRKENPNATMEVPADIDGLPDSTQRHDEWNPDQPRDEDGKFASTGGGTVAGAVKSGVSAIGKAETTDDLKKIAKSIAGSKAIDQAGKAKLYGQLAHQATQKGNEQLAKVYQETSDDLYKETSTEGIDDKETLALIKQTNPELAQGDPDEILAAYKEAAAQLGEDASHSDIMSYAKDVMEGTPLSKGATGLAAFSADKLSDETLVKLSDSMNGGDTWEQSGAVIGVDGDILKNVVAATDEDEDTEAIAKEAIKLQKGKDALAAMGINDPTMDEIAIKAHSLEKGEATIGEAEETAAALAELEAPNPTGADEEAAIEEKVAKPQDTLDHAKAARDHAKSITLHAKQLREKLKKDPSNADLKSQVEAAEKLAKSARAAARKAEKATSPEAAAKYATAAKGHAEKAGVKFSGGEVPTITKASDVKASAKSAPLGKSSKPKTEVVKPGAAMVTPSQTKAFQSKADKLKESASTPHPESWTPAKVAAKEAALKTLVDHADATTPDELKKAADAYDAVAKQAQEAGSYWGSSYSSLAQEMREAVTGSGKEKFIVHPPTGKVDVRTHAPVKSARPVDSIKGEEVHESTFKEHRSQYTDILDSSEKEAALSYSGSAYSSINKHLREDKPPTAKMKALDRAIAKAPAPRDMIVHRGMSGDKASKLFGGLKPGDQFVEKAYWSTSAGGSAAFGGDVKLEITVPKGYPAAPIPSKHPGEREYLLRRNSRMQVTKVEKIKGTYGGEEIRVHVTVLHDEEED